MRFLDKGAGVAPRSVRSELSDCRRVDAVALQIICQARVAYIDNYFGTGTRLLFHFIVGNVNVHVYGIVKLVEQKYVQSISYQGQISYAMIIKTHRWTVESRESHLYQGHITYVMIINT